jgi:hypothetical protein
VKVFLSAVTNCENTLNFSANFELTGGLNHLSARAGVQIEAQGLLRGLPEAHGMGTFNIQVCLCEHDESARYTPHCNVSHA